MQTFHSCGFTIEVLPGLPGDGDLPIYQFARPQQPTHSEGFVIRVSRERKGWIGNFQYLRYRNGCNGVVALSTRAIAYVFSGDLGYRVPLDAPNSFETLQAIPIRGFHYLREQDWVVVWGFTKLAAYSPDGFEWETKRISWDGLQITEVRSDRLTGLAWNAVNGVEVEFSIDLRSGHHTGGPSNIPETLGRK